MKIKMTKAFIISIIFENDNFKMAFKMETINYYGTALYFKEILETWDLSLIQCGSSDKSQIGL